MATYRHTETVRALVRECSADVNFPTIDGETPLFIAAHGGHTETVRALVRECSANVKNIGGETPLFRAADYGHTSIDGDYALWIVMEKLDLTLFDAIKAST